MAEKIYHILQIDDDLTFHHEMRTMFEGLYAFEGAATDIGKVKHIIEKRPEVDLVLLDLILDNSKDLVGLTLIKDLRATWPDVPIIVISQDEQNSTTVQAMKAGANNYLLKSEPNIALWNEIFLKEIKQKEEKDKLKRDLKREKATQENLKTQLQVEKNKNTYINPEDNPFVGHSMLIETLKRTLKTVAEAHDVTVMITGETGVGKGVAARFLHANSANRKEKPFMEINISTISKDLIPSQLFGHKKGSFTGANEDMKGRLEQANQGIVFIDEIGELDLENQVRLLNFLQDKTITPIGGQAPIQLDVQIVTATNKNLYEAVKNGDFRKDLLHRLQVFPIQIPPLRDRREDILPLLAYFMACNEVEVYARVETDLINYFIQEYSWPGNVRQLQNTVTSMELNRKIKNLTKVNWDCLPPNFLEEGIDLQAAVQQSDQTLPHSSMGKFSPIKFDSLNEEIAYKKLKEIEDALVLKNGKKKDVAQMLSYGVDDNLRYIIVKYLREYSHLAEHFPKIAEVYHRQLKKLNI